MGEERRGIYMSRGGSGSRRNSGRGRAGRADRVGRTELGHLPLLAAAAAAARRRRLGTGCLMRNSCNRCTSTTCR